MNVFVDTSAFYAILDADDESYPAARDAWAELLKHRYAFHTTNYVLVETFALLQNRLGFDSVRIFSADIHPVLTIAWVTEGMHRSAHHALLVSGRRKLSLVDCVSFEAMRRLGLDTAFCFDPHYSQQGFSVIPLPEGTAEGRTNAGSNEASRPPA